MSGRKAHAHDQIAEAFARVRKYQASGEVSRTISDSARADWAYGNTVIENANVTRAMAERSVRRNG